MSVQRSSSRLNRSRRIQVRHVPWLIAIPGIVLMLGLRFLPAVFSAGYAFTDWNGLSPRASSVGLDNFAQIFSPSGALGSLGNTLVLAAILLVVSNAAGLGLALLLRKGLKARNLLRAMFFIPFALSHLATGYIWQFIFSYKGPLNQILDSLGLSSWKHTWTGDPKWALYTIALVICWQYTGLTMIIYLAGLEGIPEELDDAVAVDGASKWMKFRRVTLPLLAPAVTVACTLTLIWGLGAFDQVIALTGGGPAGATETLATLVWKNTFLYGKYGYGSALALVLALIVTCLAVLQMTLLRSREEQL